MKNDPRGEYPDWPQAARDMIAAQKPKFVVMMIGLNDRRQIRETAQPVRTAKPAAPPVDDPAALELDKTAPDKPAESAIAAPAERQAVTVEQPPERPQAGMVSYEFRSDKWTDLYIKRIDDLITVFRAKNVRCSGSGCRQCAIRRFPPT